MEHQLKPVSKDPDLRLWMFEPVLTGLKYQTGISILG